MCDVFVSSKFKKESDIEILEEEIFEIAQEIERQFKTGDVGDNKKIGGGSFIFRRHYKKDYRLFFDYKGGIIRFYFTKIKENKERFYQDAVELEKKDIEFKKLEYAWVKDSKNVLKKRVIQNIEVTPDDDFETLYFNYFKEKYTKKYPELSKKLNSFRFKPELQYKLIELIQKDNSIMNIELILTLGNGKIEKILNGNGTIVMGV
ncbi:hypothetical protein JXR93_01620 [bacterium]|nr:hypothetical protein [bacterium]